MNALLTAIMNKTTGSALSTAVGGRIYESDAPQETAFPYVVFFIISDTTDDNFTDKIDEFVVQFSIFSISSGLTEISGIYENMKTLFDYCALTISGYSHIGMIRQSMTTLVEKDTTTAGTDTIRHWAVEYLIRTEK